MRAFLPYLVLLAGAYSVFCVTTDDPFITYRYAANLLAGHGLVYNVGERVEGFSSPLHLLLCALLLKIVPSLDILFKAKLLSLGLGLLALAQTGRLARLCGLSTAEGLLVQLLVAVNNNFALAGINGLETTLATCLVLAAVSRFLRETAGRGGPQSALLLFLALLARPDAGAIFAVLLAVRVAWAVRRHRPARDVVGWALVFVLLAAGLTLARLAYYDLPVPNTYYAKHVSLARGWFEGRYYLLHPLYPIAYTWDDVRRSTALGPARWQALGTALFWGLAALGVGYARSWRVRTVLAGVVLAQMAFVLRFGGDWMPGWRFLIPVLPLIALLQVCGLRVLRRPAPVGIAAGLVLAVWTVCAVVSPHDPWANARCSTAAEDLLPADNALGRKWVACNRYIQTQFLPGSVLAYSEMGYAGYNNLDKTFIDVRGLTDREIARLPVQYKGTWGVDDETWMLPGDPLYQILKRRQPTAIIAFSHGLQPPALVLDHYYLCAYVQDPRDSAYTIMPAVIYRPFDSTSAGH